MESDEGHDEGLGRDGAVLGEAQHQTLEHLVAHGHSRLPQDRAQVVTARLAPVAPVVLAECDLLCISFQITRYKFVSLLGSGLL